MQEKTFSSVLKVFQSLFSQKDIKMRYYSEQFFHCVKRPVPQPYAAIKDVKLIFLPCVSSPACTRTRPKSSPTDRMYSAGHSQGYARRNNINICFSLHFDSRDELRQKGETARNLNEGCDEPLPDESDPPSGLPLEYIVASFPSKIKRNQPLLPLESSNAHDSFQR